MIDDGRTGYLVPPRDERALASAIVRLLRSKALRQQMGLNGKQKIDAECAPPVVARATLAVYRRALDAAPSPARPWQWFIRSRARRTVAAPSTSGVTRSRDESPTDIS
jgi:hypothetical protein